MTEKAKKTIVVPEDVTPSKADPGFPMAAFIAWDDEDANGCDVSQPICLDAEGRPLYAPRGWRFRLGFLDDHRS